MARGTMEVNDDFLHSPKEVIALGISRHERRLIDLRKFVVRQLLPEIVETIASAHEFTELDAYRSFQRLNQVIHLTTKIQGLGYEGYRGSYFARLRYSSKYQTLRARVKMKISIKVTAAWGLETRIEPMKLWLKLEGDFETKQWRWGVLIVKLPSGNPLYFWITPTWSASWGETIVSRRTIDSRVV
ncbi:hypothetical protein HY621_02215 [Candidatus Uhrbacteria bacterium]|nr:hypothetical protein [Candidatus Uhrbacteria bacterium]